MRISAFIISCATTSLALSACVEDPDDPDLDVTAEAIEGGDIATAFHIDRAALLKNCSATKIGPRHVITAMHCAPMRDDVVQFYDSSVGAMPSGPTRKVDRVIRPGCTLWNSTTEDWTDCNDDFADLIVIELDGPVAGPFATPAWTYPGSDELGVKVGAGGHYDNPSLFGLVMRKYDYTYTSSDSGGVFTTDEFALNKGDSGGAFYYQSKLLGVTSGRSELSYWRARYSSVAEHINFVIDAIGFVWGGGPVEQRVRSGSIHSIFIGSHRACQFACERTASCDAYNWFPTLSQCTLLSSVTGSAASSSYRSALK